MKATLLLADGSVFTGYQLGVAGTTIGEIIFNTAMSGYQEVLTDPSYKGQIVLFTSPHIGNQGVNLEDSESDKAHIAGIIIKDITRTAANYRATETLDSYLKRMNICGIYGIDTRQLTRHIRNKGAMKAILSTDCLDHEALAAQLKKAPEISQRDLVSEVSINKVTIWKGQPATEWYYEDISPSYSNTLHVVAIDFGIKHNILRLLKSLEMDVTIVPAKTDFETIRQLNPDGIFLSNGPGDPQKVDYAVKTVKQLSGHYPVFGICLGHQILALAFGAETYKLQFGHHGSNHPVQDLESGRISITAQNHNYAVDLNSLKQAGFIPTHINLNDQTVEGMKHKNRPVFSVQYHPEASPGPHDAVHLFKRFRDFVEKNK